MSTTKAPKGGAVSKVNGCEYVGGQFMPETGEYCGLGKNRVAATKLAEVNATLAGGRIVWHEASRLFRYMKQVTLHDGTVTEQVFLTAANFKTLAKLHA